jgi:3-oxoacyl-[acyl-carrier protein] reductase
MSQGASVVLNYGRDRDQANQFVIELGGSDRVFAVQADAGSVAGVEKLVQETVQRHGRIDAVILNAGIMPMRAVEDTTELDFDKIFALNVKGPYFLVQKALPYMKPGSRVIFVSTSVIHASSLAPPYTLYSSTKGAIEHMTHAFAKDLGRKGINVNAVGPGPTRTELFLEGKSEEVVKSIERLSPFDRIGEPRDLADVFAFLVSDASRWISGQVILVNGGFAF